MKTYRNTQELINYFESKFKNCLVENKNNNVSIFMNSEFDQLDELKECLSEFKEVKLSGNRLKTYTVICQEINKIGLRVLSVKY